eukprot:TRINITY_DN16319_c0_g1_i1.p1 TRINITY_DN16319_c0_g1~~TRINITY_DN16319_c0_g1_i1.p1  ORF type:complete len:290 (+),score=51.20 TRINITY_DN16319_c0_g1_i1:125-871(+)
MYDFNNRGAVITGGAQGFGLAVAQRLAKSGATLCLWDKDSESLKKAAKDLGHLSKVHTLVVDVTDLKAVESATSESIKALGHVDVLVTSAGISGPNFPTHQYPIDAWKQVIDIDLNGLFYCCRSLVPHMIERNYGRIVNVASVAGKEGNPNAPAYSAAKAGVIALTKSMGKELAKYDIAVNCVAPATAQTRILEQCSPEHIAYMLSKIPRGRFLEVDEFASMVTWLASQENSFTTGFTFDLTGGRATY